MAVRRESVVLSLDDQFTTGMARAAAATALLKRNLDDLDGTNVRASDNLDDTAAAVGRLGDNSRRGGPEIDRLSGRLRLLRDAAIVLGPAMVPLGAAIIPALTGSIAALGAASGGIGAAILAFNGLGDAMKAIDDFELEPTAENLQAMRVELERLGPAGADFAQYLQSIGPQMTELQHIAREGMFPGMEAGIDALLTRLPQVQDIIRQLSEGVGGLAQSAGEDLAGEDWQPFLEYVRTTGRPTLEEFGQSIGNVANGLADMMVAFAPLSADFSRGMLGMSESFASWAANLENNDSFQGFLDYIREAGPQALDFLGSMVDLFVAVVKAAAPLGSAVLPILTAVGDVLAAVASTPAGAALVAAAAGMTAFGRASAFASPHIAKLPKNLRETAMVAASINFRQVAAGLGLMATAATDFDDKMGLSNTAMLGFAGAMGGPWGAAIGAGIGLTLDFKDAAGNLGSELDELNAAVERGRINEILAERADLVAQLNAEQANGRTVSFGNAWDFVSGKLHDANGETARTAARLAEIDAMLAAARSGASGFAGAVGGTETALLEAKYAAIQFQGALADLNGWFDKRQAIRDYEQSIKDLGKALKDGFQPQDAALIDQVGRNMLQVAKSIKDKGLRADFLAGARASLQELANKSGPKAEKAVEQVIGKMDELGLTKPDISVGMDKREFDQGFRKVEGGVRTLDGKTAQPKAKLLDGATRDITRIFGLMNQLDGKVATTIIRTVHQVSGQAGGALPKFASGGYTGDGDKYEPAGIVHRGEFVIPKDYVARDWSMLRARYGDLPGFAEGGPVGGQPAYVTSPGQQAADLVQFGPAAREATRGLKGLQAQLKASEKALEKERSQRDAVRSRMDALASDVSGGFRSDIFARSEASGNPWAAGSTPGGILDPNAALNRDIAEGREFITLVGQLKSKGLKGPALAEILSRHDVELARMYAGMSATDLNAYAQLYETREQVLGQAGQVAGSAAFGSDFKAAQKHFAAELKELREIKQAIKAADKKNQEGHNKNADKGDKPAANARRRARR